MQYAIIKNQCTPYHIVTSMHAHAAERFAAQELQKYLYESTGVCVPFFSDRCPRRSVEIFVGMPPRDSAGYTDASDLGEEGFLIKTIPETGDIVIRGNAPRGTLYGVYRFLELFIGFRCFTRDIEMVDSLADLVIGETDIRETPAFEYREAYFRFAFDGGFASKNRLNANLADISDQEGGHTKFYNFHHSFDDLVPARIYFDTHPEYFSEINGVRQSGSQLCLTNPEVLGIAKDTVFRWIKENPHCRVFSVGQNDNGLQCTCSACCAQTEEDGSPAGPMLRFVNAIARDVAKEYPEILIHTFAYQYTRRAPRNVKPEPNVIVRLCNIECVHNRTFEELAQIKDNPAHDFLENIRAWSKICDRLYLWDYCTDFHNYLQPFPNMLHMAENIRYYRENHIRGVLEQGNFSFGGGAALDDLKSYLIARLLWNSELDVHELIREFTDGVYGLGAPYIREYIYKMCSAITGDDRMWIYDKPNAPYWNDALIAECDALFCAAEAAAENETVRERICREHLSVEFLRTARIADDAERAAAVDVFAEKLRHFRITEIRERQNLYVTLDSMRKSQYALKNDEHYTLYYIMR